MSRVCLYYTLFLFLTCVIGLFLFLFCCGLVCVMTCLFVTCIVNSVLQYQLVSVRYFLCYQIVRIIVYNMDNILYRKCIYLWEQFVFQRQNLKFPDNREKTLRVRVVPGTWYSSSILHIKWRLQYRIHNIYILLHTDKHILPLLAG